MVTLVLFLTLLAQPQAAAPATTGPTMSAAPAAESRTIVGEIVWVDVPARLVLIRESIKTTRVKGQPPVRQTVAVSVAPNVAVTRGKKTVALGDLKTKDHVTARYVPTPEGAKALSFRVADAPPLAPTATAAAGSGSPSDGGD